MQFYGKLGYVSSVEVTQGRYEELVIAEKDAYGTVTRNRRRLQSTDQQNDDIELSNEVSVVMDPYLQEHFHEIRYVLWQGIRWKATSVQTAWPRLKITLGGVYNGPVYVGEPET